MKTKAKEWKLSDLEDKRTKNANHGPAGAEPSEKWAGWRNLNTAPCRGAMEQPAAAGPPPGETRGAAPQGHGPQPGGSNDYPKH